MDDSTMIPKNRRLRRLWTFNLIALISGVFLLVAFIPPAYDTPEALMQAYTGELQDGNKKALLTLIEPNYDGSKALDEKLQAYGGTSLENLKLTYIPNGQSSVYMSVDLEADVTKASGKKVHIKDRLELHRVGQRVLLLWPSAHWFLVMGNFTGVTLEPI